MRRAGPRPAALLLLAVAVAAAAAVGGGAWAEAAADAAPAGDAPVAGMMQTEQVVRLDDGTVIQVEEFRGPSRAAALLPYLFTNTAVDVACEGRKDFSVFTGASMAEVRAAYGRGERAFCGLPYLLNDAPKCSVGVRPHGPTFVAVAKPKTWLGSAATHSCSLDRREELSMLRVLGAVLGAFLFWYAPVLSQSTPFRLTGGTLGFTALSFILILLFLYRRVPHKGKLLAGTAVFGSTAVAAMRYAFGVWLPSLQQVMMHPVTLAYLALSGLTGLGVTYYVNDATSVKVNTMLRVALQLVGLASVYLSATMHEASVALCAALLGARAWGFLQQQGSMRAALFSAKRGVQQLAAESEQGAGSGRGFAAQPAGTSAGQQQQQQTQWQQQQQERTPVAAAGGGGAPAPPAVSPLIQRGLVLNEETGHIIGIGKGTYNRLLESGYVVNEATGTITPPPPSPDSPARRSRGSSGRRRRS